MKCQCSAQPDPALDPDHATEILSCGGFDTNFNAAIMPSSANGMQAMNMIAAVRGWRN